MVQQTLSTHWVIANKIRRADGGTAYGKTVYLNRVYLRRIAKSRHIVDARAFKTLEQAREVLEKIQPFYTGKWFIQEVTQDLDVLNENGLPYLRRFKVLKEVE